MNPQALAQDLENYTAVGGTNHILCAHDGVDWRVSGVRPDLCAYFWRPGSCNNSAYVFHLYKRISRVTARVCLFAGDDFVFDDPGGYSRSAEIQQRELGLRRSGK